MEVSDKILLSLNPEMRQKLATIAEKRKITKQTKVIRAIIDQVFQEVTEGRDRPHEDRPQGEGPIDSEMASTPINSVNLILRPRANRMIEITRSSGRILVKDVEKPPEERDQRNQQMKKPLSQRDEDEEEENGEQNHDDEEDEDEEEDQGRYISKLPKKS